MYDFVIVGGGFFGSRAAILLARQGKSVLLLERDKDFMQRASYANQARVHGGYHYPRSILTALRSRVNLPVFSDEYADCIDTNFEQYYAIAHNFSKVSAQQFRLFCERIQAPITPAPASVKKLFNDDLIEDVFTVKEHAFDSAKIKAKLLTQMNELNIDYQLGAEASSVQRADGGLEVSYMHDGTNHRVGARRVLNCTYSRLNELNRSSGLAEIPLKHEIAEVALVEPPSEIANMGITVMCGPFFSTMPFPARKLYSFTHVRYTPRTEWHEPEANPRDPYAYLTSLKLTSDYPKMLADAARYMPVLARGKYVESLYEVKTVLPQSEGDDSRPILYRKDHDLPGYTCIVGGKFDNIYDVLKELEI